MSLTSRHFLGGFQLFIEEVDLVGNKKGGRFKSVVCFEHIFLLFSALK